MARHIGYYNDPEDIRALAGKTPEAIVRHYRRGKGNFMHSTDPGQGNARGLRPVTVGRQKFYVRKSIDLADLDSEDNFIDIYRASSPMPSGKPGQVELKKLHDKFWKVFKHAGTYSEVRKAALSYFPAAIPGATMRFEEDFGEWYFEIIYKGHIFGVNMDAWLEEHCNEPRLGFILDDDNYFLLGEEDDPKKAIRRCLKHRI